MIRRLLNLALVVLLAPLLAAFVYEGALFLASVFTLAATQWFLVGAAVAVPLSLLMVSNSMRFIEDLLHEVEHASVSFLFTFQLPKKMEINPEETSKVEVPTTGGCLVTLAPYYFALLTIPFLLLKALLALVFSLFETPMPAFLAVALDFFVGATLMFHYLSSLREFRFSQTDLKKTGFIPSIVVVLFLNFMMLVLSLTVVIGSYAEFWEYLKSAVATTVAAYTAVLDWTKTRVLPFLEELMQTILGWFCEDCTPTPAP